MKYILLLLTLFSITKLQGQNNTDEPSKINHQISIGYNYANNGIIKEHWGHKANLFGLEYNYFFNNKGGLRVGAYYNYVIDKREYESTNSTTYENNYDLYTLYKLGYEFHYNIKEILLIYGAQIYHYTNVDYKKIEGRNSIDFIYENFGISPFLGLKYMFTRHWGISFEASPISYSYYQVEDFVFDPDNTRKTPIKLTLDLNLQIKLNFQL